ncbi:TP53 regulating kinase [Chamberlinius hualienensis]
MTDNDLTLIKQGAEAKIYLGSFCSRQSIIKERFSKKYRHPTLDEILSKDRTKSEARMLVRCRMAGIKTPAVYFVDLNSNRLWLEYIKDSVTVKEYVEKSSEDSLNQLAETLGYILAKMHKCDVIHGDLTTSNILLCPPYNTVKCVTLIDFGLSHLDSSTEDKGVDLYVLKRAYISSHPTKAWVFDKILESYAINYQPHSKEIMKKYAEIELRGRKRSMVG